jgi:hypothetical protein
MNNGHLTEKVLYLENYPVTESVIYNYIIIFIYSYI